MACKVELSEANRLLAVDAAKKLVGGDYYGSKIDSGELNPFEFVQLAKRPLNYSVSDNVPVDTILNGTSVFFQTGNVAYCDSGYLSYSQSYWINGLCPISTQLYPTLNSLLTDDFVSLAPYCPNSAQPEFGSFSGAYAFSSTAVTDPVLANVQTVTATVSNGHAIAINTPLSDWVLDANMCPIQIDYSIIRTRNFVCKIISMPQYKADSVHYDTLPVEVSFLHSVSVSGSASVDSTTEAYRFSVTQDSPTTPTTPTTPTSEFPLMEFTTFFIVLMITLMLFGMATR